MSEFLSESAIHRRKQMEEGGYWSLIFSYGLPALLSSLAVSFYSITDRIFVGHGVGPEGLAVIALAFPVLLGIDALSSLFSIGGLSVFSRLYGAHQLDEARGAFCSIHALVAGFLLCALVGAQIFAAPLLRLCGATDELVPLGLSYFRVLLCGSFFSVMMGLMVSMLRSIGHPKLALACVLTGQILNVALDYLFIFPLQWGVAGAAWATALSMVVSCTMAFSFLWLRHPPFTSLPLHSFVPRLKQVGEMLLIGLSPFVGIFGFSFTILLFNRYASSLHGQAGLAAVGVFSALDNFLYMPVGGIWNGVVGLCAYNYGSGAYHRVKGLTNRVILLTTVYLAFSFTLVMTSAPLLTTPFLPSGTEAYDLAVVALRWGYFCMWGASLSWMATFLLDGLGRYVIALVVSLLSPLLTVVILPLLTHLLGWRGVFLTFSMVDLLRALVGLIVGVYLYRVVLPTPKEGFLGE